ncbi:cohesin domain-containing protein [Patescibacteria group bacterium]
MNKSSLLIIFLIVFFAFPAFSYASGASLYLSPNEGTFFVGSTFDISVFVNTGINDVNSVRVDLKFDPKKIQIANPTTGRSFISVWVAQPTYSNIEGTASFQGGIPSPGINTSAGLVSTITFRAIAPGETNIYFMNSSRVLLNDGKGTDVLNSISRGVYELKIPPPEGPIVFSPTHPDQNQWHRNNNPNFSWEKEDFVTDFSYSINNDFSSIPDNISEGNQTSVSYTDLESGIWYFHVKAKKGNTWGGTSHYIVQIDNTPPAVFEIDFEPKLKSRIFTSKNPIISFITTDAFSGISHYELKAISFDPLQKNEVSFFTEVTSPYKVPTLLIGEHEIIVRVFDNAGNWRDSSTKIEVIPLEKLIYITKKGIGFWIFFFPWWQIILFIIFLLLLILIVFFSWRKKNKRLKKQEKSLNDLKNQLKKETNDFQEKIYEKTK